MAANLSVREQKFVNNFVGSADVGSNALDREWRANLELDLWLYRYPHTAEVRGTVKRLMAEKTRTGTFTALPEAV